MSIILIFNFIVFIFGVCIGSFLNVCIYRIPIKLSVSKGRSMCPSCNHQLGALDLVPIFSYLFLGQKCRYCKKPISPRYAAVELLTGFAFVGVSLKHGFSWETLFGVIMVSALVSLSFIDIDTQEIPDRFNVIIAAIAIASAFLTNNTSLGSRLIGTVIISLPMLVLAYLLNGFGGGDVKLMFAAGFLLGWQKILLAFMIGTLLGTLFCIPDFFKKKGAGKNHIAFGPYLAIGIYIAYILGAQIINWYISFL